MSYQKRALITGITGQDGSHLADLLLSKDYEVHALIRRCSANNRERIAHLQDKITLHEGDLIDAGSLRRVLKASLPDEIYNLAAQSHVGTSFSQPVATAEITGMGVLRLLDTIESMRGAGWEPRFYQASSSEMFGDVAEEPQTEATELRARSPYGAAKVFAHHMVKVYREAYGLHASCGILFNHEGPRRGLNFVTRKITHHVARQALGLTQEPLELGNLDAKRDWGFAGDYVEAMWLMLQAETPDDFVIATGETYSVQQFLEETFRMLDLDWRDHVETDPRYLRPAEVDLLLGDASKARRELGWTPKVSFSELVQMMVESDMALANVEADSGVRGERVRIA